MKMRVILTLFGLILCFVNLSDVSGQTGEMSVPDTQKVADEKLSAGGVSVLTTEQIKKWGQYQWPRTPEVLPIILNFTGLTGRLSQSDDALQKQYTQIQAIIKQTFHQSSWWSWHNIDTTIYNPVKIEISLNSDTDLALSTEEPGFFAKWFDFIPEVINSSDKFELRISAYQMQNASVKSYHQLFRASLSDELWHELQQSNSTFCSKETGKAHCLVSIVTQQAISQLSLKFMPHNIPVKARRVKPNLWQLSKPYGGKSDVKMVHLCYAGKQVLMGFENRYCAEIGTSHLLQGEGGNYRFSPENWHPDSFTEKDYVLWPLDRGILVQ